MPIIAHALYLGLERVAVRELAGLGAGLEPRRDPRRGRLVMQPEAGRVDELGLVDDPVDLLVIGDEAQIGGQRALLGVERPAGVGDRRGDLLADPLPTCRGPAPRTAPPCCRNKYRRCRARPRRAR